MAVLRLIEECLEQIERPGWNERVWLPEALRLKGWMLMRQGRRAEAEASFAHRSSGRARRRRKFMGAAQLDDACRAA